MLFIAGAYSEDYFYYPLSYNRQQELKWYIIIVILKNNKDNKVTVTFKCDQNGKKTNLSLTITK